MTAAVAERKKRAPEIPSAECDLSSFREAFALVAKAAAGPNINPVLQSVLIECGPDGGSMLATDNEVGIRVAVAGLASPAPLRFLVPAQRLSSILGAVAKDKGSLALFLDGPSLRIKLGGADEWKLLTGDVSAHPGLPSPEGEGPSLEIAGTDLAKALRRTSFACNPAITTWALGGVNVRWEAANPGAIFEAADGNRVACQRVAGIVPEEAPAPDGRVVPLRLARMFLDAAKSADGTCRLSFPGGRSARLEAGPVEVVGRLQEGRFPGWGRVVARETTHRFSLAADDLRARIARAASAASESTRTLDLRFDGPELVVESPASESGSGRSSMAITPDGEPITIAVVAGQVLDALATLEGLDVELDLGGAKESAILRADGLTYPFALYDREKP